ncbi:PIN domain protein [Treponema vincentii ATCC 35580]|uniref:Ribonuclease VapC n=2 Tax=Treponema vincentii TaxID=69710 RepID=C8PMK8_9SPIR|nr:PIN domain protein [Treponema vincentii ATCC 35580]
MCKRKHQLLYAVSYYITKRRQFVNPRLLIKAAVVEFIGIIVMYLLDTNICIFLIKNKFPVLTKKIFSANSDDLFLSAISIAEIEYGASKSQQREKNRQALLDFCADFNTILDFTTEDTEAYGMIRAYLEKKGNIIGPYDMQIAAQAMTRNLIVITNNYDEFVRIPWIKLEDWTKE